MREQVLQDVISYVYVQHVRWFEPSGVRSPIFVGLAAALGTGSGGCSVVPVLLVGAEGAGVSTFNFKAMCRTVAGRVLVWLDS